MAKHLTDARVDDEVVDTFITASRALVGLAVRSINAAPVEVTMAQHRLLVLLATGGDQTVKELAEQLQVNASNATRLCDRLQRLGLVARDRSSTDGRAVDVSLTPTGRALVEEVRSHRRREVRNILARMPVNEIGAMNHALRAFTDAAREAGEDDWPAPIL